MASDFSFGQLRTDHMFLMDHVDGAWRDPRIVPYGPFAIDPGAVVRFEKTKSGDNRIVVRGALVAAGTAGRPIRFIPKDKASGPWYGIEFAGGSGRVEHCVFEGATKGVDDRAGKARVSDLTFR